MKCVAYSSLVLKRTLFDLMDLGNMDSASGESRCWITPWKHVTSFEQVTSSSDSLGEAGGAGRWRGGGAAESYAVDDEPQCVRCIQYVCRPRTHTQQLVRTDEAGGAIAN